MRTFNFELPIFDHHFEIPEGPASNKASKHLLLILGCMVYSQALRQDMSVRIENLLPPDELPDEYLVSGAAANDD